MHDYEVKQHMKGKLAKESAFRARVRVSCELVLPVDLPRTTAFEDAYLEAPELVRDTLRRLFKLQDGRTCEVLALETIEISGAWQKPEPAQEVPVGAAEEGGSEEDGDDELDLGEEESGSDSSG